MKLEIMVGDKKLIEPDFKIFTNNNNKTLFFIAMKVDIYAEKKIRQSINDDEFKIEIQNGIIGLSINDRIYSFDVKGFIRNYLITHVKNQFSVAFAFLDENDKIKKENVKAIRMKNK
ncbi:hypothetical protein OD635_003756 [Salmonella enterica]|nr:hypothetical protein [Salmonella enterica]